MAYEPPRERKGRSGARRGSSNRRQSFGDGSKGRGRRSFGRDSGRDSRGPRRELQMTRVTCSDCGEKCEVPFKPTSTKPVYCRDCFDKKNDRGNNRGPSNNSSKDLEIINEKLDKIMKSLSID
jgi:CxxC-x17-CxxC domain-containing protein